MSFKSNFTTPAVVVVGFCLIGGTSPAPACADLGDQLFNLLADDAESGDWFGTSVAISGTIGIVGASRGDNPAGPPILTAAMARGRLMLSPS